MTSPRWSEFFNALPETTNPFDPEFVVNFKEKRQAWINGIVIEYEVETKRCPVSWVDFDWTCNENAYATSEEYRKIEQSSFDKNNWWHKLLYEYKHVHCGIHTIGVHNRFATENDLKLQKYRFIFLEPSKLAHLL